MLKTLSYLGAAVAYTLSVAAPASAAYTGDPELDANEFLFPGQRLFAGACDFDLVMQGDGNLVAYDIYYNHAVFATNTVNKGGYVAMQGDGNFVMYNWSDKAVWSTNTQNHPGAFVYLDFNGAVFVLDKNWNTLWWAGGSAGYNYTCNMPPSKTYVTNNTDRFGGDYADLVPTQSRPSWCGYFCSQDSQCKAYTYVPPGVKDASPHCFLKNVVHDTSPAQGMVSGRITG